MDKFALGQNNSYVVKKVHKKQFEGSDKLQITGDEDGESGSIRIIDNTTISFNAPIDEESSDEFIQTLFLMRNSLKKVAVDYPGYNPRITVLLSTSGGSVYDALRMHDVILGSDLPVDMYASGLVASAGIFLLVSGSRRYSFPYASFLYHEVSGGFSGNKSKLRDYIDHTEKLVGSIEDLIEKRTNLSGEQLKEMSKKEYWFDAVQALELGFVDKIVTEIEHI